MEKKTSENNSPATTNEVEQKKPVIVIYDQMGFDSIQAFDEYISTFKVPNYNNVLTVINLGIRSVIKRGAFSLEESEAMSVALRYLNGAFVITPEGDTKQTPEA